MGIKLIRNSVTFLLLFTIFTIAHAKLDDATLAQVADQVSKTAPRMMDAETRLDGATGGNNVLTYNYTLVNYSASELDKDYFRQNLADTLKTTACGNSQLHLFFKNGVSLTYAYRGKDGALIDAFVISPQDCGY